MLPVKRKLMGVAAALLSVAGAAAPSDALAETYAKGPVYIDTALRDFWTAPYPTGVTTDVNLRWAEDTPHSSRMSINLCSNYGYYWARDFAAHSVAWHLMTTLPANTCFVARGYSNAGAWSKIQAVNYQS